MSKDTNIVIKKLNTNKLNSFNGTIVCFLDSQQENKIFLDKINFLTGGLIEKIKVSSKLVELDDDDYLRYSLPNNKGFDELLIFKKVHNKKFNSARELGSKIATLKECQEVTIFNADNYFLSQIIFGFRLKSYRFDKYKKIKEMRRKVLNVLSLNPEVLNKIYNEDNAIIEGITFSRDLTNEPSNVLTTTEFSKRLKTLKNIGVNIKILEEATLHKLGMRALLGVGQGSPSPSKVVIMEWKKGKKSKPLAILGKGVVFDTGGISIKPASGMEQMTVDMGGAGVVAGLMKTLALRKAKGSYIGVVGLVENMPDGNAQRPGDIVKSMKGDTIEIINTDAEGRLVLCDLLWYVQKKYKPAAMIDLATLTGAIIVALGNDKAGVFSNDQSFANKFLESAKEEDEGAWQMPLDDCYDKLLTSNIADIKNVGGRAANSISAAKFLHRFVDEKMPWIHLDIAGVVSTLTGTQLSPKGATGWGVRSLNNLSKKLFETL